MYIDALLKVASAQAFGAAGVSASSIDLSAVTPKRQIGTGEAMGFGVQITTAATVAAPIIEIISATDDALTTAILSHASTTIALASAVAGLLVFIALPLGTPTQRYLGVRITTAGGTVSASAWLSMHDMFSIPPQSYAKGYVV